jgi:alginate O-acetyltransferase complex protein AlgI
MFGILHVKTEEIAYALPYYVDSWEVIMFVAAVLCSIPIFNKILEVKNKWALAGVNLWLLFLFILSSATIAASTYNPFIYFRF